VQEQLTQLAGEREQAAAGIPEALLTVYDRLREQKGGVGAAALRARRCGGCSLELTAADLRAIAQAPSDELLRCEECNRILVRTAESGI
jgi:predicted  nucleic acid-binding Zn-ribbon protein